MRYTSIVVASAVDLLNIELAPPNEQYHGTFAAGISKYVPGSGKGSIASVSIHIKQRIEPMQKNMPINALKKAFLSCNPNHHVPVNFNPRTINLLVHAPHY